MEKSNNSGLQNGESTAVKPNSGELCGSFANKVKFPLWVFPETMDNVENFYAGDNCRSKSEFIEKAINFYVGYLKAEGNVNYLSPIITASVDAVVHGAEQRINRNLFKIAVELGTLSHMPAAADEVDSETVRELHKMCVDEVRHINGVISLESAVEFQNE